MIFRNLRADEIECRVGTVGKGGFSLLLYKDARCDMAILDETVGPYRWERYHEEIKGTVYCKVGIYDPDKDLWVFKEDAGAETFTEKEKGEASDSFKRACVNWGIGRALYSATFVWIRANTEYDGNRYKLVNKSDAYGYQVAKIGYSEDGKEIVDLVIVKDGQTAFEWQKDAYREQGNEKIDRKMAEQLEVLADHKGVALARIHQEYGVTATKDITKAQWADAVKRLQDE